MSDLITLIIQLIEQFLLPNLSNGAAVKKVLDALVQIVPIALREAKDLVAPISNIIAALRSSGEVTPEQLDQLDALEKMIDDDFDKTAG